MSADELLELFMCVCGKVYMGKKVNAVTDYSISVRGKYIRLLCLTFRLCIFEHTISVVRFQWTYHQLQRVLYIFSCVCVRACAFSTLFEMK